MPLSVELLWIEGERERERETGLHWSFISSTPPQVWVIRQSSNHGCYVVPSVPCRPLQCPQGRRGSFHLTSHTHTDTHTHTHTHIHHITSHSLSHKHTHTHTVHTHTHTHTHTQT